jgi:hypothetical protein
MIEQGVAFRPYLSYFALLSWISLTLSCIVYFLTLITNLTSYFAVSKILTSYGLKAFFAFEISQKQ